MSNVNNTLILARRKKRKESILSRVTVKKITPDSRPKQDVIAIPFTAAW